MSQLAALVRIAWRNLFASFLNIIIGLIILGGTFFFVVGSTLLQNIDSSMSQSIIGSISGHAQVYSDKSKDKLSLFNDFQPPDISAMPDFAKVKASLSTIENVKTVIPMGINNSLLAYGNTMDQALERLRKAVNERLRGDHSAETSARIESLKSHVRQMISVIQGDLKNLAAIANSQATDPADGEALAHAASESFWADFDRDPLNHLEFLENKISSLVPDADFVYLNYVGTDLEVFKKSFDRLQIVDGVAVPPGQRGMMLSKIDYENQFKLKIAHRLDRIKEAIDDEGKTIASDPDLRQLVKHNQTQTREIVLQLDPLTTKTAVARLQKYLNSTETDVAHLLTSFLATDDANFADRYRFFYAQIAPLIEIYRLHPGDVMTMKSFTKNGFVQSINIKVYGTFQFKGLEKSDLAGSWSLMDMMSFRDLYGYMTPEKLAEMKDIEKSAGTTIIDRNQAENELFGGSSSVTTAKANAIDESREIGTRPVEKKVLPSDHIFTTADFDSGMALNAALILNDPSRLRETMSKVDEKAKHDGLDLRVVTWQEAAGNVGQFVFVAKAVLYAAVFIIFIVALVVINNAVMMVTLQRIREIGTMRAIGAQRSFVLSMVILETIVLGLVFGCIGIFLGAGLIRWLGGHGIPAVNSFLYFFFSGPRLYPVLGIGSVIAAFFIVLVVTMLSALYPAIIATRVSPVMAMQNED